MNTNLQRRRALGALGASAALAGLSGRVLAQAWPNRPLRLIVAAGAGSSLDVIARSLSDGLKDRLGQPVVVDNRPAAGGTVAMDMVAKSTDGHTLGIGFNGPLAFAPFLYSKLSYDPFKDLVPIVLTTSQPNVLAVNAQLPIHDVRELIAYAKKLPGKLNYASVGNASSSHLSMELLKALADIFVVHIPFNGAPPAALAVATGEAQMLMAVPTAINPHVQSGKLRIIGVTSKGRYSVVPSVTPIAESGVAALKNFESLAWNGLVAPAGTSVEHISRLNQEVNALLKDGEIRKRLAAAGLDVVGGTSAQMHAFISAEAMKWQPIIRRTGAKLD